MYREKPVGKWVGPYFIRNTEGKMMTLDTGDRHIRGSIDKFKLYKERSRNDEVEQGDIHPMPAPANAEDIVGDQPTNGGGDYLLDEPNSVTANARSQEPKRYEDKNEDTNNEYPDILAGIQQAERDRK